MRGEPRWKSERCRKPDLYSSALLRFISCAAQGVQSRRSVRDFLSKRSSKRAKSTFDRWPASRPTTRPPARPHGHPRSTDLQETGRMAFPVSRNMRASRRPTNKSEFRPLSPHEQTSPPTNLAAAGRWRQLRRRGGGRGTRPSMWVAEFAASATKSGLNGCSAARASIS